MDDRSSSPAGASASPIAPVYLPVVQTALSTATATLALVAVTALGRRLTGELHGVDSLAYALGNVTVLGAAALIVLASTARSVRAVAAVSAAGLAFVSTLPGVAPLAWLPTWALAGALLTAALAPDHLRVALAALADAWSQFAATPEYRETRAFLVQRLTGRPAAAAEPTAASPGSAAPPRPVATTTETPPHRPLAVSKSLSPTEPPSLAPAVAASPNIEVGDQLNGGDEADAASSGEEEDLEAAELAEEFDPRELRCELARRRSAEGVECWTGKLYIELAPGRRAGSEHIAFCPPLPTAPHVEFQQVSGPPARIQATEIRTFGLRWEVRLLDSPSEPVRVAFTFSAYSAPQAGGKAA